MVGRVLWEHEVAGSNPVIPTITYSPIVQLVERQTVNLYIAGSSPARRAKYAGVAQLAELLICNQWVGGSSPFASSIRRKANNNKGGITV